MAGGIAILGYRPIGWRFMSTFFGALTLAGMYVWAFALFEDEALALWVALLTLFNQLLYVQARIGMLDTFMFCFVVWGCAAFTLLWNSALEGPEARRALYFTGVMLGLGVGCKWFAVVPWASCVALVLGCWALRYNPRFVRRVGPT